MKRFEGHARGRNRRTTATFERPCEPERNGTPPGSVRTLKDMSKAEIKALEKQYGMKIKPRTKKELAELNELAAEREALGQPLWR